jgi:hypothetical protein
MTDLVFKYSTVKMLCRRFGVYIYIRDLQIRYKPLAEKVQFEKCAKIIFFQTTQEGLKLVKTQKKFSKSHFKLVKC